jgi:L-ribulose-5-phosphate 3-epimerase UlaE
VVLGTGNTQFERFFEALRPLDYTGPFIMQAYRDAEGVAVFKQQLAFLLRQYLDGIWTSASPAHRS